MITVKIDEGILLDMLMGRVEYWVDNPIEEELFEDYYRGLVYSGCFEGCELNIMDIVDDDYVNNTVFIHKKNFEEWKIEDEIDDRIIAFDEEEDLYLIRTY